MFENKEKDQKILVCACNSLEHQIHIYKDEEDGDAYINIHLRPGNFIDRLRNGLKYIFGHRSNYGDFDEFLFKEEHADALIELGNFLKEKNKTDE